MKRKANMIRAPVFPVPGVPPEQGKQPLLFN